MTFHFINSPYARDTPVIDVYLILILRAVMSALWGDAKLLRLTLKLRMESRQGRQLKCVFASKFKTSITTEVLSGKMNNLRKILYLSRKLHFDPRFRPMQ